MRWIKSPAWDLVWILNALWLAPLVLLLAWGHHDARASPVDGLFFALTVPLWFGHRVSSAWLAYATPAYRPLLATQRLRFVVTPLAIAVACFALLLAPESVLPMPLTERVVCLAILDYLLVSHHFAAQHFGLLSLYRARAGRASDVFAHTLHDGGIVFVVILTALMLHVELRSQRPSLPRVAYFLGVSAMVLFAVLSTLLLPVMEVEAVTDEYAYADRLFGAAALWLRSSPFVPALLALGFATGFIHYLLDRAAFRFSSPDVRQAARGLLRS